MCGPRQLPKASARRHRRREAARPDSRRALAVPLKRLRYIYSVYTYIYIYIYIYSSIHVYISYTYIYIYTYICINEFIHEDSADRFDRPSIGLGKKLLVRLVKRRRSPQLSTTTPLIPVQGLNHFKFKPTKSPSPQRGMAPPKPAKGVSMKSPSRPHRALNPKGSRMP